MKKVFVFIIGCICGIVMCNFYEESSRVIDSSKDDEDDCDEFLDEELEAELDEEFSDHQTYKVPGKDLELRIKG